MKRTVLLSILALGCDARLFVDAPTLNTWAQPKGTESKTNNRNPLLVSFTANPTTQTTPGQPIGFQVIAADEDGDNLIYAWSATGGTLSSTAGRVVMWTPPATPGTYMVNVSVSDGKGGSAEGIQNLIVNQALEVAVEAQSTPILRENESAQLAPWAKISTPVGLNDASFSSFHHIWGVGDNGKVLHSVDTARTWDQTKLTSHHLRTVHAQTNHHVWVGGDNGELWKTSDAGQTWTLINTGHAYPITDVTFVNLTDGYYMADQAYATHDGGETWTSIGDVSGNRLTAIPTQEVWAYGEQGLSLFSDGGWIRVGAPSAVFNSYTVDQRLPQVQFLNDQEGYSLASGTLYKSLDGGFNWEAMSSLRTADGIYHASMADGYPRMGLGGFLLGENGELLVTGALNHYTANTTLFSADGLHWTKVGNGIQAARFEGKLFGQGQAWILADRQLIRWGR